MQHARTQTTVLRPRTAGSSELNDLAQLLDCVADILWCTVCACMQTQAKQVRLLPARICIRLSSLGIP